MKKALLLISIFALSSCMKNTGPDESTIIQGSDLRLPPEYALTAPENVKTIKQTPKSSTIKAEKILLDGNIKQDDELNVWLLRNAGGQTRVKNIKAILQDDLKQEAEENK